MKNRAAVERYKTKRRREIEAAERQVVRLEREMLGASIIELFGLVIEAMEENGRDEIAERLVQGIETNTTSVHSRLVELASARRVFDLGIPAVRSLLIQNRLPLR